MDRDSRWERVERGYDAIVHGVGEHARSAVAAIEAGYERGENDEFLAPTVIDGIDGTVRSGDPLIHANFRADRARQLTHALADREFVAFDRSAPDGRPAPTDLFVVTMTEYEAGLPVAVAFPPEEARSLAQAFSEAGWRQFHVAETEKYAHVTYFFNGGVEAPYPGRGTTPRPEPAGRDLRPRAGDERGRSHRRAGRGHRLGALRLHRRQLRQPRHGRPHRRLGRDAGGARSHRRLSRPGRRGDRGGRCRGSRTRPARCWRSPRTTATPTSCATPTATRSRPTRSTRSRSCSSVARRAASALADGVLADVAPTILAFAGLPPLGGDDRPLADLVIASVAVRQRGA